MVLVVVIAAGKEKKRGDGGDGRYNGGYVCGGVEFSFLVDSDSKDVGGRDCGVGVGCGSKDKNHVCLCHNK
jgi:hypothetical protein